VEEGAGAGAFLTANPFHVIQSGHYNRVPWMAGVVTNEGILRAVGVYREAHMNMHYSVHCLSEAFKMDDVTKRN
jgi:hypothetical protein